ncbi:MAG: hypothetical protein JWQ78_1126 [Sediminibacterium sp.]|nr:hypothetical protein [Sediminibacterium sp.]
MDILIFKTNLETPVLVNRVQPVIQTIPGIQRWNVDMQDCDNVLRIEATAVSPRSVERLLQEAGYFCEELRD